MQLRKKKKIHTKYFISKIVELILTIFLVTIISFLLMKISPIDAAEAYAQRTIITPTQEQIEQIRVSMGLNDSIFVQYGNWLKNAVQLDFGNSYVDSQPVFNEVMLALRITSLIILISGIMEIILIVLLGWVCFMCRKRKIIYILNIMFFVIISLPTFFLATSFLNFFAVKLGWIDVVGNSGLMKYLPAALCFTLGTAAFFAPLLATNIEKIMKTDSAYYAKCRGLSDTRILFKYAIPSAMMSILPNFFQMLGLSFAGSIMVERVFCLPGLGNLIIHSVIGRDTPMIHATLLVLAIVLALFNILADICRRLINKNEMKSEVI